MLKIQNKRFMTPDNRQESGTQVSKETIVKYYHRHRPRSCWFVLARVTYVCEHTNFRELVYAIEEQNEGWFYSNSLTCHGTS